MLERDYAAIYECHCLIWILYLRRDVRRIKRIIERIAKDDKAPAMMCAKDTDAAAIKPWITITKSSVAVAIRIGVGVTVIDPGFSGMAAGETVHFLIGRTPGEPDRILRHTGCDLALSDELLLAGRQAGVEVAMLGDA